MKRFLSCFAFVVCFHFVAFAQQRDENPVLMTVAGKPVTRAEFEYAYNKNNNIEGAVEHKTVEEYAEMFLNYKLKVAEAESQRIDKLQVLLIRQITGNPGYVMIIHKGKQMFSSI